MKAAIISDIHGNIFALEAVLTDIKNAAVDVIFNLGDILYGPVAPKETYQCLQAENCITIQGNQDRDIYQADPNSVSPTVLWVLQQLSKDAVNWLQQLPREHHSTDIYACHGSPQNDCQYLLEDISHGWPRVNNDQTISEHLKTIAQPVVVCGHSHIPRTVWLESGKLVVNPGSVGLPAYRDLQPTPHVMENYSPHASYALVEKSSAGWQIQHRRIAYPHKEAALLARQNGRPDWAYALMTGRAVL